MNRTTRKPRLANNLTKPVGSHWTVTRVLQDENGRFGFCINDDGYDGFIPRHIVDRYEITQADEGAGFYAPTRPANTKDGTDGAPQIMPPILFDEDIEE